MVWHGNAHRRDPQTFQYTLRPTPAEEQALEAGLGHRRTRYTVALEQRKTRWGRGHGIGASYYQQKAEPPGVKAAVLA
jgi:hypothetical protein